MGQGGTATAERPFATRHLQDTVGHCDEIRRETTNVSSCLFHLTRHEERLPSKSVRVLRVLHETQT
jgi:hypothetical protein